MSGVDLYEGEVGGTVFLYHGVVAVGIGVGEGYVVCAGVGGEGFESDVEVGALVFFKGESTDGLHADAAEFAFFVFFEDGETEGSGGLEGLLVLALDRLVKALGVVLNLEAYDGGLAGVGMGCEHLA